MQPLSSRLPLRSAGRWLSTLLAILLPLTSQAAHLEFVAEVNGTISDVTPQRILYSVREEGVLRLKVLNRISGSLRTIPDQPLWEPMNAFLTSRGAIYGYADDSGAAVFEWTGSAPRLFEGTPRGLQVSPLSKQYAVWASWVVGPAGQGRYVHLRDVLASSNRLLGNGSFNRSADVSDGGEVVFTQGPAPRNVFRYRNGQTVQLTAPQTYEHFDPLTDGINVVYGRMVDASNAEILMYNDIVGEEVLRPAASQYLTPREDYQPSGGWVGFTRINTLQGSAIRQVWLRSPQGGLFPVSTFGTDSYINAVSGGQVMYVNGGYLYLGRPGMAPVLIAPFADGTQAVWLQSGWHVYFGGALYRVVL
jgi:hypothetical protein